MSRVRILLLLLMMQTSAPATPSAAAEAGSELRVSVITLGPGSAPWEKFGHNMLRIQDAQRGIDVAFNWGVFSFSKTFIFHFLQGRLWYWMQPQDTAAAFAEYKAQDRDIWEQELDLSPAQRETLWDYCVWNAEEANRSYRYDYYRDNCSTRVRDAIAKVVGPEFEAGARKVPSDVTYRSETDRLMSSSLLFYTGLHFVLSGPVDQPLTSWEEMFIPMRMRDRMNQTMIRNASGEMIPLVKGDVHLYQSRRTPPPAAPPYWMPWFLLTGLLIGGVIARCGSRAMTDCRRARWGFVLTAVGWALIAGLAGALLVYGWALTDHRDVYGNENMLQMSPLLLPLVILIPRALRGRQRAGSAARWLALIALGGSILGLILQILPTMNQVNGSMIALALPINAGLAFATWKIAKKGVADARA